MCDAIPFDIEYYDYRRRQRRQYALHSARRQVDLFPFCEPETFGQPIFVCSESMRHEYETSKTI